MRGAVLPWAILTLAVWILPLTPPAAPTPLTPPSPPSAHTLRTPQITSAFPPGLLAVPEGGEGERVSSQRYVSSPSTASVPGGAAGHGDEDPPLTAPSVTTTTTTATTARDDYDLEANSTVGVSGAPPGGTEEQPGGGSRQVTRRSLASLPPAATTSLSSVTDDDVAEHRHRHHHAAAPLWLREHLEALPTARRRSISRRFEEDIAAVFRGVAYGGSTSYRSVPVRRPGTRDVQGAPRIERTTTLSEEPLDDYLSDGSIVDDPARNESLTPRAATPGSAEGEGRGKANETDPSLLPDTGTTTDLLAQDPQDNLYPDLPDTPAPNVTGSVDAPAVTSQWQGSMEQAANGTEAPPTNTHASLTAAPPRRPTPRMSWLDVLRCTHRGLAWVLVNFFLGFLLLTASLLGPYRLMTMRCCTPLLPRTHYVAVHLLVFVAASLKAVYLFHLAFGSRGRLPLVLLLLLTNTGFPCLSSAFLVLMMMMFVAADVQVYKSKLVTAHNAFVFLVVMLGLAFIGDVIVGVAHSRSVLVLARVMVIGVAAAGVAVFLRRRAAVVAASQLMRREFQGELKLLVLPAKDDSLQRHMGVKHILRSRLGLWCRAVKVSAAGLALLSLIHLLHTIFLISAHVPAWAWWFFHVSGCLVEALLAVSTCVAAALTQRYDESVSFAFSFVVPPQLLRGKAASAAPTAGTAAAASGEAETIYQRVSFSSGTESTQYTACCPEGGVGLALAGTPQAPRRRGAPVKRSATFSHTPQVPHAAPLYGGAPVQVARVGSASNLPLYGPVPARGGVYGPGGALYGPVYAPTSDASVLVHEDGFVRVRTPLDRREAPPPRPHGSLILLQQAHFQGSSPQLRGAMGPEPPPRQDLYQSLSRRRKASRGPDVLQNNIDVPETDYHPSPHARMPYGCHSNLPSPHSPARDEPDYYSLSRRGRRGLHPERANYDVHSLSWRRRSQRDPPDAYMNNLDRPEADYSRQVSREDNNDPVHHHYHDHYASRRSSRDARSPSLNVYEEQAAYPRPSTLGGSPGLAHKVSNRSFSPSSPSTPPAGHASYLAESPRARRQAKFPRPFVRVGSNRSLQGEDLYACEYVPRGNPVRRNHSSAGYYPSRYMAPSTPSLVEAQRYGSLRLARTRKRQPAYVFTPDGKLLNRRPEEWSRNGRTRTPEYYCENGPEGGAGEEPPRDCPSRQSTSSKKSDGTDQDWATELIKSSSMLTDFYSLSRDKKKVKKRREEIVEEQEHDHDLDHDQEMQQREEIEQGQEVVELGEEAVEQGQEIQQ
ncbi:uncharacterized protein LOC123511678 isoform X1 [Portunus trituberculatus]|uniref:uncharacterized protein LOC123511678 isoform X1 n=1 Tax=Portunus trituberculatus TaxID=210409 RepID=UPI001E1CD7FE|nr:uncharacterized protein LOC123511678 isoform X1 [Portunus trituberculatus]XP_045123679.1 uncharacterized protein LOC123511678 isoform X2 [Portunus trituberculatus]XP_045123687.1 uncharacterized protein LOC123511678 isoform X3 [Portunus trituberculatus]XP_045123693.1 uncharacterized protein LOC123511678 isoform X1 [Portunus trituberculatus]